MSEKQFKPKSRPRVIGSSMYQNSNSASTNSPLKASQPAPFFEFLCLHCDESLLKIIQSQTVRTIKTFRRVGNCVEYSAMSSEKYIHRRFLNFPVPLATMVLCLLFSVACKTPHEQLVEDTKRAEEAVKIYPRTKEVDDLCTQSPKPGKFELIGKIDAYRGTGIKHYYYSPVGLEEVKTFYNSYFADNGWQISIHNGTAWETLIFKKDTYRIEITLGSPREGASYSLLCRYTTD
jgi:hypothetical protein